MLSPSPQPRLTSRRARAAGFTLVELLTVIAIISILCAITLNVLKSVSQHSLIARTQGELSSIAQALAEYKALYGDYPQLEDDPANAKGGLCDALTGKLGPTGVSLGATPAAWGKCFLDVTKFTFSNPTEVMTTPGACEIMDPFGNQYRYIYKAQKITGTAWKNPGYLLYSAGVDGQSNDSLSAGGQPGGYLNTTDPLNLDNIYAPHNP